MKKEAKEKLLKQVKEWAGQVSDDKITELGEKKFAYSIKGQQKGDYVLIEFSHEAVPSELENRVRLNEDVIRHLLTRD